MDTIVLCPKCGLPRKLAVSTYKDSRRDKKGICVSCARKQNFLLIKHPGVYPRKPLMERFWAMVEKTDNCWLWKGSLSRDGYGLSSITGNTVRAHRLAFEWAKGVIPKGMTIDHLCRNRACVNPDHLEIVTNRDNILRGIGFAAKHARATHCLQGHLYDLFNTYLTSDGHRDCRTCRVEATRRWRARQRIERETARMI